MSRVVNGDPANNVVPQVKKDHSTFDLKEVVLATHRFGEYHPHLVIDGISSDKQPWRCIHEARSHTLKAPLMQDIQLHKDYFMVNLRAILPLQAQLIIKNPKIGDDVPADAYTSVSNFIGKISSFITSFDSIITDSSITDVALRAETVFKKFVLTESVFSRGSLLASLGCNLSANLLCADPGGSGLELDIDDCLDGLVAIVNTYLSTLGRYIGVTIDGVYYQIVAKPSSITFGNSPQITMHEFLQRIRDTSDWSFGPLFDSVLAGDLITYATDYSFIFNTSNDMPLDLARVWAYHLAVAEYFTDDSVDYIYSAELFRQYICSLFNSYGVSAGNFYFSWNGSNLSYDYLSSHFFDIFVSRNFSSLALSDRPVVLQYFLTLFGFHRSLRYRDYFVGSRTRPLAIPGSGAPLGVPVVNNQVEVINVTKGIQSQRFYNAVNAARDGFNGYLKALFGVDVPTDAHVPIHLAHTVDGLFASKVENTGDAQQTQPNSVTAVFRSNSSNFEFTARVVENCIIIGMTSYDIERCYPDMVARSFFIRDRYDMFLPQMQYIGDQEVFQHELFSGNPNPFGTAFGYQFRDMQYKQLINRCEGAINSDKLPGYAFVMKRPFLGEGEHISPDFIRARNSELDDFYLALTGYSLGNYFHFILNQINLSKSARPMTAKPQIL